MVNDHHKEMEKILVKTRAFDRAKELLEKNRHVVIKGVPGAGKTTLAKYLLKIFMDQGKRPLQVFKMSKVYGRVSPNDNFAIFIDNAFGESSFSINDFNNFINKKNVIESLVKPYNSGMENILILTIRNDIYMEIASKQKSSILFFSSVTDLSTGEYALESEEFIMFLNNYNLPGNIKEDVKLRQAELYLPLGFPQCCRLARENPDFGNDLSIFFRFPSIFLKRYLETLIKERAVKLSVLIYILLKGGSVRSSLFSVHKDRKIKCIALKMLQLSSSLLGEFHESVKVFEGFLTMYNKIYDSYSFSHSSVTDILFHILIPTFPEETIQYCHPVLLQRLTTTEHLKCTNVLIDADLFSIVSSRIIQILRDGFPEGYKSISFLELWNDKGFYEYILADQDCSNHFEKCVDSDGNTLLVHFGKSGHISWVKYLLQSNCDEKQKYKSLNAASRGNHVKIVDLILSVGTKCDLNTCFNAVQSGNLDLLFKLCKAVDLNQTCSSLVWTDTNLSLVQEVYSSKQIHLVQPLLDKYPILIDIKSSHGESVLHYASEFGDLNLISYLVANYPQLIDLKDNDGYTALHSACISGDKKLISYLIEKGLDINALTNDGANALHIACLNGRYDACEFLVTNYPQLIDVRDNKECTVLHLACVNGDRKLISFLIEKGLDINALTNDGANALHLSCLYNTYNACELLVTNYPQLINVRDNKGFTVLHLACVNGDRKLISFLIEKGLDINALTNHGESVLHVFCRKGKFDACEFFVTNYRELIDIKDNDGYTVLHAACVSGNRKLISFLIEKGLDINALTNDGESVLHIACLNGKYDECEFFVTNYPQLIDIRDNDGYTILHAACVSGNIKLISFLIEKGLDINALTNDGANVLHIACGKGKFDACEFLVTNYPQLIDVRDNDSYTVLHLACVNGERKLISFLVEKGLDINALTNDGSNVLHIACLNGSYDACEFLVTNYPQLIDVRDNDGYTLLHWACVNGDRKVISFLIEIGLDINALTNDGANALHIACLNGRYDACEFLVTNYAQLIDIRDNKECTVLHLACVNGDRKLISFLIEKGLDINALTNDGANALHLSCLYSTYDACEFLVTNYPQLINVRENKGFTVLHLACVNGDRKLISFLIEKGLDINALTNHGESVLHIFCRKGKFDACEFSVTNYRELIDIKDNDGYTVLHAACVSGKRKLISFLIEKGLDINALTNDGESVLHIACLNGKYDACEFFVTNYPQLIDIKDNDGHTILHAACVSGNRKLISFLIEKGLDINALTNDGESVLHIACLNGKYDACEFLVTNNPQLIDVKDNKEYTVLHSACVNGDRKLISFLIEKGLDINALTNDWRNVLHIACGNGKYEACEFFVTNYSQLIDVKDNKGYTVLHLACVKGNRKLISFLIEKGLDMNALTNNRESVLHIACGKGNYDACELFVTNYPQLIYIKDRDGWTVIHAACANGNIKLISLLIEKGLGINALTNDGTNALHLACLNGKYDACEFLVTNNPQLIDTKCNKGFTILHLACVNGDRKLISFLIEKGLDINALTNDGESVVHIACRNGNIDLCKFIVHNYPLLLQAKDYSGMTVLHAAASSGNLELFKYLVSVGLDEHCLTNVGRSVVDFTEGSNVCLYEYLEKHYPDLTNRKRRQRNQGCDKIKLQKLLPL